MYVTNSQEAPSQCLPTGTTFSTKQEELFIVVWILFASAIISSHVLAADCLNPAGPDSSTTATCGSNPCLHGTCSPAGSGAVCCYPCDTGYTGSLCEIGRYGTSWVESSTMHHPALKIKCCYLWHGWHHHSLLTLSCCVLYSFKWIDLSPCTHEYPSKK